MNLQFDSSYGLEYGESSPLLVQVLDSARDPLSGETVNCSSSGFSFLKGTIVTAYGSASFYRPANRRQPIGNLRRERYKRFGYREHRGHPVGACGYGFFFA